MGLNPRWDRSIDIFVKKETTGVTTKPCTRKMTIPVLVLPSYPAGEDHCTGKEMGNR